MIILLRLGLMLIVISDVCGQDLRKIVVDRFVCGFGLLLEGDYVFLELFYFVEMFVILGFLCLEFLFQIFVVLIDLHVIFFCQNKILVLTFELFNILFQQGYRIRLINIFPIKPLLLKMNFLPIPKHPYLPLQTLVLDNFVLTLSPILLYL